MTDLRLPGATSSAAEPVGVVTSASMTRHSMEYCGWFDTIRSKPRWSATSSDAEICAAAHSETPT